MSTPRTASRPAPTIPRCGRCGKQRVLYGGVCKPCAKAEQDEEARRG